MKVWNAYHGVLGSVTVRVAGAIYLQITSLVLKLPSGKELETILKWANG